MVKLSPSEELGEPAAHALPRVTRASSYRVSKEEFKTRWEAGLSPSGAKEYEV